MPAPDQVKILFLAAQPENAKRLGIDEELREIDKELLYHQCRGRVNLVQHHAVRPHEILTLLHREQPDILHFSGHGMDASGELVFLDDQRRAVNIPTPALVETIRLHQQAAARPLRAAVFNACWSDSVAEALLPHVGLVVGMTDNIFDPTAHRFSALFYAWVGEGFTLKDSFDRTKHSLLAQRLLTAEVLKIRLQTGQISPALLPRDLSQFMPSGDKWGDEPDPTDDLTVEAPAPFTDGIRAALFEQAGGITKYNAIHEGKSGARVFLVTTGTGKAFAKVDRHRTIARECRIHQAVAASAIRAHAPNLLTSTPIGPHDGWSLALYQPALDTTQYATSFGRLLESRITRGSKAKLVEKLLSGVLAKWHTAPTRYPESDERNKIPNLLRELMNIGNKTRMGEELKQRALVHGFPTGNHRVEFEFSELEMIYPNPFAYLLDDTLWTTLSLNAPRTPIHGDLHGGNIMCRVNDKEQPVPDTLPWLIDFAQSHSHRVPFFDLAYLEMDILLRLTPAHTEDDSRDWLAATEFLCRDILPDDPDTDNQTVDDLWDIVKPIRTYANGLITAWGDTDARDSCAFWLSAVAAGMMVTRRSRMLPPEKHVAALLYTARALSRLMNYRPIRGGCIRPKDTAPLIRWQYAGLDEASNQAAPPPLPPVTEKMIRAYVEGLRNEQIRDLERVQALTIDLAGQWRALTAAPAPDPDADDGLTDEKWSPEVWAALHGDPMRGRHQPGHRDIERLAEAAPVANVTDTLTEHERAVLLGEPGAGKTVTLKKLALRYVQQLDAAPLGGPIPVFVPLAKFTGDMPFEEYAARRLLNLRPYVQRGELPAVWLLDALNEMPRKGTFPRTEEDPNPQPRDLLPEVVAFLQDQLAHGGRFVLSCRVKDFKGDELSAIAGVDRVEIAELGPDQIRDIIYKRLPDPTNAQLWHNLRGNDDLIRLWNCFAGYESLFWDEKGTWEVPPAVQRRIVEVFLTGEARQRLLAKLDSGRALEYSETPNDYDEAVRLRRTVYDDPRKLMLACRSPYTLNMVCDLAHDGVEKLPAGRGELFQRFANALLIREERTALALGAAWPPKTLENIVTALERTAAAMQAAGQGDSSEQITELPLEEALAAIGLPNADDLLKKAEGANLIQLGEMVRFTHQLLQEYFAVVALQVAMQNNESAARFFGQTWWEPGAWRETVVIFGEVLNDPQKVARWLAPVTPEVALDVVLRNGNGYTVADLTPDTRQALLDVCLAKIVPANERDPRGRAAAGRALAQIGDPRPGVLDFDIQWCDVPGGPFQMGGDPDAWNGQQITLHYGPYRDYRYWVAPYPVTYAQYAQFVADGGYTAQHRDCWTDAGWDWKKDKQYPEYAWNDTKWHIPNHPVVGVTWYESYAFAAWVEKQRRAGRLRVTLPAGVPAEWVIRLPTEAEWEKAARWPDGRKFPWGDTYTSGDANIDEKNSGVGEYYLQRTSAVGLYRKSGTGAYDQGGNVWEWLLSEWADTYRYPEANGAAGTAARGVRGGSWSDGLQDARVASRVRYSPLYWFNDRGFRVVVSAPVS